MMDFSQKNALMQAKTSNTIKTFFIMGLFLMVIVFLGFIIAHFTGNISYLYGAFFASLTMNIGSYFFSARIALSTSGAVPADEQKYAELLTIVQSLSVNAEIPSPKVYIINDPAPNAFATGCNENNAAIAVTTGLLAMMNKSELEGVIAHELSHIRNKDILIMTVMVVMAGMLSMLANIMVNRGFEGNNKEAGSTLGVIVGLVAAIVLPLAATLIQLSISRKREFVADASGALVTGYPEGLASALQKISGYTQPLKLASSATAHLYISCPFGGVEQQSFFQKLFMTHPPVEERIRALRGEVA